MRFYEFAPKPNRPVLKISQQAQQRAANTSTAQPADTPTPFPRNTTPTATAPVPIKVYSRAWQHDWVQKYLAAQIAKSAQTVKPTEDDLALAFMKYGETQSKADKDYQQQNNHHRPVTRRLS